MKKVLVIGIDGATWKLLDPWIKEGILPNFARMVREGFSANLRTTIPPMTAPGWISLFTGKNPGRHGIFDLYRIENFQRRVVNSRDIKSKQVWEILSEQGKKVIVINPPIAYPVRKVDGYFIAGMLTPSYEVDYTYPPRLKERLRKWGYQIGVELDPGMRSNWARSFVMSRDKTKHQKLIDFFNQISLKRWEVFKELAKEIAWQFGFVMFEGGDRLQHYYWRKDDFYVIREYYLVLDRILGECLDLVGKEGMVMIVSDHGFGEIKKKFYINNFLAHYGFLQKRKGNLINQLFLRGGKEVVLKLARLGFPQEKLLTNHRIFRLYQKLYRPNIDPEASQVFMLNETSRGLWINAKDDREYEEIRNLIIKRLEALRDSKTGKRIIKAYKREEIYQGFYVEDAPDILLVTYPHYSLEVTVEEEELLEGAFLKPTSLGERNADHEMEGVFIAVDSGIKKERKGTAKGILEIIDVAPTILEFLGVRIPIDMDGKVYGGLLKGF